MGKGRDKRKKAQEDKGGGRKKAKADKRNHVKNLEKHSRRLDRAGLEDELKEEDIELLLEQYKAKETKKREVIIEDSGPPSERTNATFVANPVNHDEIILFGGEYWNGEKTDSYNDLYRYNVEKNTWKCVTSPCSPTPRSSHQSVCHKHYMLTFGGEFTSPSQSQFYHHRDLWRLDLNTFQWEECKTKEKHSPSARSGHRMILWKKTAVLFGGFHDTLTGNNAQYFNDLWLLQDLDTCPTWRLAETTGEAPSKRSAVCLSIFGDTLFLYGGFSVEGKSAKGMTHHDLYMLNLNTLHWSRIKKAGIPPNVRSGMSVVSTARRAIFFGGVMDYDDKEDVKSRFFNDMYAFNMDSKRWFPLFLKKKKEKVDKKEARRARQLAKEERMTEAGDLNDREDLDSSSSSSDSDMEHGWDDQGDLPQLPQAKKKEGKKAEMLKGGKKKRALAAEALKAKEEKDDEPVKPLEAAAKATNRVPIFIGGNLIGYEDVDEPPHAAETPAANPDDDEDFKASDTFTHPIPGYAFKAGPRGVGYYKDVVPEPDPNLDAILSQLKEKGRKTYKEVSPGQIVPCGRFGSMLCAVGNYLYIYGGQFEDGNREVTLNDLFRLNLNRMETFEPLVEMDLSKQDWYESDEEEDDDEPTPEQKKFHGKADSDTESESDSEDASSGSDGDEEEEGKENKEADKKIEGEAGDAGEEQAPQLVKAGPSQPQAKKAPGKKRVRSKREELQAKLNATEGIPTPEPHEPLKDFFSRTVDFWQKEAHEQGLEADITAADAAKALRKVAFRICSKRFGECRPILEQIEFLDNEDKKEQQWREQKEAQAREAEKQIIQLQKKHHK